MSTDNTELTFVRCPSCRSLVPAISTRCRMCGANLESSNRGEGEDKDDTKVGGRVRQRTMSPQGEFTTAIDKIRHEMESAPSEDSSETTEDIGEVEDSSPPLSTEDPLGAYLEELDTEDEDIDSEDEESDNEDESIEDINGDDLDEIDEDNFNEEDSEEDDFDEDIEDIIDEFDDTLEEQMEESASKIETDDKKSENLNLDKQSEESPMISSYPKEENRPEIQQPPISQEKKLQHKPKDQYVPKASKLAGVEKRERKEIPGRLFGWFVNFAEPGGSSIELREGRFFVTNQSLKKTDLVLEDPSVSTPHAMVVINTEVGLQIQDLMSDRGIFVREGEAGAYRKEIDPVELKHGDWVRFGDVEFLVSLIAHVGEK